jgi:hypothetical protein
MPKRYPPEFRRTVLDLVASDARSARWFFDLDLTHTSPYRLLQGRALDVLADVHPRAGDDRNARDPAPRGLAVHRRTGYCSCSRAPRPDVPAGVRPKWSAFDVAVRRARRRAGRSGECTQRSRSQPPTRSRVRAADGTGHRYRRRDRHQGDAVSW